MKADLPLNAFKRGLAEGRPQLGLWSMLPDPYVTEILCNAGFDWMLLDCEHSPNDLRGIAAQLQAGAAGATSLVVRLPVNDTVLIKQFLDAGVQSLLLPQVQSAAEAASAVAAIRYPPHGVRGVAVATRASRFGRVPDYHKRSEAEICLLVQVETRAALAEIEAIAALDGIDGIFIGPSDLAASLGHLGNPGHPDVVAAIDDALDRIRAAGKPAGILATDPAFTRRCLDRGTLFTAVGTDLALLLGAAEKLASDFKQQS